MKKRIAALLVTFALVITAIPVPVLAAATSLDDPAVYYTPASDYKSGDCILTATKMMIRRAVIMRNAGDWTKITNESIRKPATISGLLMNSFVVDAEGLVYNVECGSFTGQGDAARINEFAMLLNAHPEGIVVHGTNAASSGTHGVLVVSVVNGVPYAADSSRNTGLYNKGIQRWDETTMLEPSKVTKYWYISEISASTKTKASNTTKNETSTLRIKSLKAPNTIKKGKSFTIKGTVKSNKKIKKVTVRILDGYGNKIVSVTKKPNSKSYSIKKLNSRFRFGKLGRGMYTFQIIATDSAQKLELVNKPFIVE